MRIEIILFAALAVLANAAPQWPYRDAVAPYYYGYPGKTPYMYRSGDEDDERDESVNLGRQDLKVAATPDGGSTVTVVEDDEKADGVRVVETGSAKPLKPVVQSANNNQQQQDQQPAAVAPQAQQPLSTNNANNAQQTASGQPLTVQQPGQQPPAFPPARPPNRPRPDDEDEDEEDDESEEDDEEAEDEEDDGDDDEDEDEEDEEDRRRNNIVPKEASSEEPVPQPILVQSEEPQASLVNSEGSDEVVQVVQQPAAVEQSQQVPSQSALLSNKVNKNKQSAASTVPLPVGKNKKKAVAPKVKPSSGAIEALVPGYVTDQGEVLVPVDTVTGSQPITIVPDPFSPPSRIVAGPRPIPQSAVPSTPSRQVPYWYRSSPTVNPLSQEAAPLTRQTLYTPVPPPGSIFTFDDDDDDDDADDTPAVIPGNRLRQDAEDDDEDEEDEEEDDRKKQAPPPKVPLAAVPAVGNSGEDDEAEAIAFINGGRPVLNQKPPTASNAASGNKKPAGGGKPTGQAGSNESDSEEDPESEEDDVDSNEEEEDDSAARTAGANPAQLAANPMNRGRMYVDEEFVSFPPSRSPAIFAVFQGKFPGAASQQRQQQPHVFSAPNPSNPYQRFVVRVTPSNKPNPSSSLYYRPTESRPPNRKVVPVASFDVSVEDTRPSSSSVAIDSEEDSDSISVGRPTPVSTYPFVYKVQGSVQGPRVPSGGPQQSLAALLGQALRSPPPYYGAAAFSYGGPGGTPPRPGPPGPYRYRPRPPYSYSGPAYGPSYGPRDSPSPSFSYGPPRPGSGGPPVIVRRKQPGGGPNRPPKPHLIAVYNPTGSSAGPKEPVDEEYYTFEVPEHDNKIIPGSGPPKNNKRPTVHRKPTPVVHQKLVSEDEEEASEEQSPGPVRPVQIIPQGTVRRRIRGGKQLKPKKNSKKNTSSMKKQQQDQQDPLGLLSKINKSKTKMH